MRHTDGTRGCLDTGRFEGFHQLFEAFAFFAAQQVLTLHMEVVESQFVFLHAAVAQDLDFAAGHALGRERVFLGAGGFFGEKHGQTFVVVCRGIGARHQGHDLCAGGVGDPRLVAGNLIVTILVFDRAGAQGPEVGPCVWLCEDSRWQGFGRRQTRQPFFFLFLRAARDDQFGGNL